MKYRTYDARLRSYESTLAGLPVVQGTTGCPPAESSLRVSSGLTQTPSPRLASW